LGRIDKTKFVASLFLLATSILFYGCKSEVCANEGINQKRPTRDVSCPNGKVCYGGECIAACNAGSERFNRCEADTDCKNDARPYCVDRFCTACKTGTYCVPALNICAPVKSLGEGNGEITDKELPFANEPLDAGPIDGAMFSSDTGVGPNTDRPPTHVVKVDIAQISDYVGGQVLDTATIDISSQDVTNAQLVKSATAAESSLGSSYRCDLQTIETYVGTSSPADIGPMGVGNLGENNGFVGDDTQFVAAFIGNRYQLNPSVVPNRLLEFSVVEPAKLSYIGFAGMGTMALGINNFPAPPNNALLVPYALQPGSNMSVDSEADLRAGYRVSRQSPTKLIFLWESEEVGGSFQVRVRILGQGHEIKCTGPAQNERIEVVGRLLSALADLENLNAGATLTIYLERVYARQLEVPIEMGNDTQVKFSIQVRHSHRSSLTYE